MKLHIGWLVLAGILGASVPAGATFLFGNTKILGLETLFSDYGYTPEYQAVYIRDLKNPATCIVVITHTETHAFTATAVDPGSCEQR